jgi:2-polyprenyl-6-methoxyphenol hydroxylase-like FAD-dependent oxidoreductase
VADGSFDVAIVGASVAGCAAARLFGQAGARVALIEKRPDTEAYKVVCTHAILSSASPTIERMGLAPLLEERGVPRVAGDAWTPYSGWIRAPDDAPRGWGVTRRTLDPLVRELAVDTPGVELMSGRTATGVFPGGVEVAARNGGTATIRAPLVVGADGRHSAVARLARVPGRVRPNNRFAYFAYWRGVQPESDRARVWLLDPDGAAHFPNEDGLAVMVSVAHRSRLPEFRADLEGAYMRTFDGLADGPDFSGAERVSKMIGSLEHANVMRPAARPGLAFVGDAAVSADPLFGVGLSWAFQSAEWLVRGAAPALREGSGLDAALDRYRRRLRRELGLHHFLMSDYSTGRRMHPWERAGLAAIPRDDRLLHAFEEVASRRRSPLRLLDPRLAPHTVRALALSR